MLRWDGALWHVSGGAQAEAGGDEPAGELAVMLDLGPWMLLRFCADLPGRCTHHAIPKLQPMCARQLRGLVDNGFRRRRRQEHSLVEQCLPNSTVERRRHAALNEPEKFPEHLRHYNAISRGTQD